jgi:hypothetical protein
MSLFPEERYLQRKQNHGKHSILFLEMLQKCQKYATAINAKGKSFPTEPVMMALLLKQHKIINWLQKKL